MGNAIEDNQKHLDLRGHGQNLELRFSDSLEFIILSVIFCLAIVVSQMVPCDVLSMTVNCRGLWSAG